MNVYKAFLIIFFAFCCIAVYSQTESTDIIKSDSSGYIIVSGYVEKNNKPVENASVIVYRANKRLEHLRTPPTGRFTLKFEYNKYYKVEITKQGMVTKKFEFDTQLPIGLNKGAVFPFDFTIVLFPKYNYIDMSVLDKPLAIVRYDKKYEDFFYDYNYAKTINDKVMYIQHRIEELTREYSKCVDDGRQLFEDRVYRNSLTKFERAHEIFPDEPYPIERIALIKKILNEKKSKKQIYDEMVQEADNDAGNEEFEKAIDIFGQAIQVMPKEKYPMQRIKEIRKLMDKFAMKEDAYRQAIEKGDMAFEYKKFQEALSAYAEAGKLFAKRNYPKDKIKEIVALLNSPQKSGSNTSNNLARSNIGTNPNVKPLAPNTIQPSANYNENISRADEMLEKKKYNEALQLYNYANKQQPGEKYAKEKISNINNIIINSAKTDIAYKDAVGEADKNFNVKNYDKAKTFYKMALNLKPEEKYPQQRLSKLDSLSAIAQVQLKEYNKLVSDADEAVTKKNYSEAKKLYQKASDIRPFEVYPHDKIIAVNKEVKVLNDNKTKFDQAVKQGNKLFEAKKYDEAKQFYQAANNIDPDDDYPVMQMVSIGKVTNNTDIVKQTYDAIIAKADKLFKTENYNKAIAQYKIAGKIYPDEKYPQDKITEINNILLARMTNKELYEKFISEGDNLLNQSDYQNAINSFSKALTYKPEEKYPKDRIAQINKLLDESKNSEETYLKTIAEAETFLKAKDYQNAKNTFQKAVRIKPAEQYPKNQITEINKIINDQLTLHSKYDNLMFDANRLFRTRDYIKAKSEYQEASALLPDEQLPKDMLSQIEKIMAEKDFKDKAFAFYVHRADSMYKLSLSLPNNEQRTTNNEQLISDAIYNYKQAVSLKPEEIYPKNKIDEINKLIADTKNKENLYKMAITDADKKFNTHTYSLAIDQYKNAQSIKPDETYPQTKIDEITKLLEQNSEVTDKYNVLIATANRLFNEKEYVSAKMNYQEALLLKPDDTYPKQKINEIEKILTDEQNKVEAFYKIIQDADESFDLQDYIIAKNLYVKANELMPGDPYPKDKITEINKLMAAKQNLNESYKKMMLVADRVYYTKDYEKAQELYKKASELKPDESAPKTKLAEIDRIIKGFEKNKQLYSNTIVKADDQYELKHYKEARDLYKKALDLYPIQKYPKGRITEINDVLRAEEYAKAIGEINKELIEKRTEKKFTFNPITDKSVSNQVIIEIKNLSNKKFNALVWFGKDDRQSAGTVIPILADDKIEKYGIHVGQFKTWLSVQNNWISILPLGGDIEVISIQILQGN